LPGVAGGASWRSTITVRSDVDLERRLIARLELDPPPRSVWVTDLVDPRTAFYRRTHPQPVPPDRSARMAAGRDLHDQIESALAEAPHLEVRRQRGGIVGQIDMYDELPTELKTTGSPVDAEGIRRGRPTYLEQLGLYCGLVDRVDGRLLVASTEGGPGLRVFDATFPDLTAIWQEAVRGAGALRTALESGRPGSLPACGWRGRGCPYEDARVCECTGAETPLSFPVASRVGTLVERPSEAERLLARWKETRAAAPTARRLRDLMYPRRAFFERIDPEALAAAPGAPFSPDDSLYRRLADLLEDEPAGAVTRVHPGNPPAPEAIPCYQGEPFLLKSSRVGRVPAPAALLQDQPNYFLELGIRCAIMGRPDGWLFIGYDRAERAADRVRAYRVRFDPTGPLQEETAARRRGLETALATGDPAGTPACPGWMVTTCPYRQRCGCGSGGSPVSGPTGK
jgi:hypothetical protein